MTEHQPKILVLCDYYSPGYKAGGPIRAIKNFVEWLHEEFEFKIITRDRDFQDDRAFTGINRNTWEIVKKSKVMYLSPQKRSFFSLYKLLGQTDYDILYLNSYLSPIFTIKPLLLFKFRLLKVTSIVLAPRGEFSPGFLALKRLKRCSYIIISRLTGLYNKVIWQASSMYEEEDIRKWFGKKPRILVATDLPPNLKEIKRAIHRTPKAKGQLRVIFLSRVCEKKNLLGALEMIRAVRGQLRFDIFGPIDDQNYWNRCREIAKNLPPHIKVNYRGDVPHEQVAGMFAQYDIFFFPTLGENFGYVILESLLSGCPVLISDQTPWRGLAEKGVGWEVPLEESAKFGRILQRCVDMDAAEFTKMSMRSQAFAYRFVRKDKNIEQHRNLFYEALGQRKC